MNLEVLDSLENLVVHITEYPSSFHSNTLDSSRTPFPYLKRK